MQDLAAKIDHLRPCYDAREWLSQQTDPQQAWNDCPRGDWMLWLIGKHIKSEPWSDDRKPFLACCLDCAATVSHLWPAATAEAVAALRQWIAGECDVETAKMARLKLWSAAAAAAAYAAYAADADAAAADAAHAAARTQNRAATAAIVRKHYPEPPPCT